MTLFNLFDTVQLIEAISLSDDTKLPVGTLGTIVEIYPQGEVYDVELLGDWVKYDDSGHFLPSHPDDPFSFVQSFGVETLTAHQISLVKPASETVGIRGQLLSLLDDFSDDSLAEIKHFAEFLKYKQSHSLL